jgi:carbon-monoxide dehydrogenase medium subunit
VIPAPVEYARAADLEHALELLADPDARAIAGGQSLLPVMKLRIARPSLVVDLQRLPLRGIDAGGDDVRIGALTTWDELVSTTALGRPAYACIQECARGIGDLQVRNRGTIGGSLAHADPASDMPAVLLALGATVVLRSASGERTVPVSALFLGPFTTVLDQGELITDVIVPTPAPGSGSAYVSVEHPASGFALAGAAALAGPSGTTVAVTGVTATPLLLPDATATGDALANVEVFGDRFAPEEYRRHLAEVVARRALELAQARATEDAA